MRKNSVSIKAKKAAAAAAAANKASSKVAKGTNNKTAKKIEKEEIHSSGEPVPLVLHSDMEEEEDSSSQESDLSDDEESSTVTAYASYSPPSPFGLVPKPPSIKLASKAKQPLGSEDDEDEDDEDKRRTENDGSNNKKKHKEENKKRKPGIVFLSTIPPGYNVSQTTTFFSQFGRVGRVFLKPDEREKARSKDNRARNFREGWVEFLSKRVAKEVAGSLNSTPVAGKKRSKAHGTLWNVKYLPRFKWTHLTEQMALEKALHQSKMRTEVSKAKREAEHFRSGVEKGKRLEKAAAASKKRKGDVMTAAEAGTEDKKTKIYEFRQKETDEMLRKRKILAAAEGAGATPDKSSDGAASNLGPPPPKRKSTSPATAPAAGSTTASTSDGNSRAKGKRKNKAKGKALQKSGGVALSREAQQEQLFKSVYSRE